jgi:hypothetical protein
MLSPMVAQRFPAYCDVMFLIEPIADGSRSEPTTESRVDLGAEFLREGLADLTGVGSRDSLSSKRSQ